MGAMLRARCREFVLYVRALLRARRVQLAVPFFAAFVKRMAPDACQVCLGSLPPVRRLACPWCAYVSCLGCQKRYLLALDGEPRCMSCGRGWNREMLHRLLPRAFCEGSLAEHRRRWMLEREKSMLPAAQGRVERELTKRRAQERLVELKGQQETLREQQRLLGEEVARTLRLSWWGHPGASADSAATPKTFHHKCPGEGCRGFLSSSWKCGVCEQYTCSQCNEVKGPLRGSEHECRPGDVETMRMIRGECRECPGCGTPISRVDGCNQMWCTRCHVAFHWRTGERIVNAPVHNPHMHEWQRTQAAAAADPSPPGGGCGMPSSQQLAAALSNSGMRNDPAAHRTLLLHRFLVHTENVELGRLPDVPPDPEVANEDLRALFLLGDLSEAEWETKLQRREKHREKTSDVRQLLQMFTQVGVDMVRRWYEQRPHPPAAGLVSEFDELCAYFNSQSARIRNLYKCVVLRVEKGTRGEWVWERSGRSAGAE